MADEAQQEVIHLASHHVLVIANIRLRDPAAPHLKYILLLNKMRLSEIQIQCYCTEYGY